MHVLRSELNSDKRPVKSDRRRPIYNIGVNVCVGVVLLGEAYGLCEEYPETFVVYISPHK